MNNLVSCILIGRKQLSTHITDSTFTVIKKALHIHSDTNMPQKYAKMAQLLKQPAHNLNC